MLVCSLCFKLFEKVESMLNLNQYQIKMFYAHSRMKDGDGGNCGIKWRTDARDSPNLMLKRA